MVNGALLGEQALDGGMRAGVGAVVSRGFLGVDDSVLTFAVGVYAAESLISGSLDLSLSQCWE